MNREQVLSYLEFQDNDIIEALGEMSKINDILADPTHQTLSEIQRNAVVAGVAMHLQSFYTGLELVLKNTLQKIDGIVPEGDAWHARLLKQAHRSSDHRQAIISKDSLAGLDNLRGFRHVIRNLYGTPLNTGRVLEMVEDAKKVSVSFDRDWKDFKQSYQPPSAPQTLSSRGPR